MLSDSYYGTHSWPMYALNYSLRHMLLYPYSHAWVVAVRLSSMDSNVLSSNTSGYLNRAAFANFMNAQDDQPYIVAEIDASNYPRTFALGDNSSTAPYSDFPELDYNGPLLEGRYYSFFVRFFSPSVPVITLLYGNCVHSCCCVGGSS